MALYVQKNESLFKYYLLPFIGYNKESFGEEFIEVYPDKGGTTLWVEVSNIKDVVNKKTHKFFVNLSEIGDRKFYVYKIPSMFYQDAVLIIEGKYSHISNRAKRFIRDGSGLIYDIIKHRISKALLALDRHPTLIDYYIKDLNLTEEQAKEYIIDPETELMDSPKREHFIEFYLTKENV